jgi:hypothetical protein
MKMLARSAIALTVALTACSGNSGREFARYYDPEGLFTTNLPAANLISVTPPQSAAGGPSLLTGVVAAPPQPSPAAQGGLSGLDFSQTEPPDQTVYRAFAITTTEFEDLGQMGLFFLTSDPAIDVQIDDPVRIDGHPARLLVADVRLEGQTTASLAVAITLGRDVDAPAQRTGFLLAAVFPPRSWDAEREDFMRILASFRTHVPPGMANFPVAGPAA